MHVGRQVLVERRNRPSGFQVFKFPITRLIARTLSDLGRSSGAAILYGPSLLPAEDSSCIGTSAFQAKRKSVAVYPALFVLQQFIPVSH
jgi:hypothetical protein